MTFRCVGGVCIITSILGTIRRPAMHQHHGAIQVFGVTAVPRPSLISTLGPPYMLWAISRNNHRCYTSFTV